MPTEKIEQLLWEIAEKMEKAASLDEYEKLEGAYKALKNQWNKKAGNKLIYKEI